jgi:hypothetical protein
MSWVEVAEISSVGAAAGVVRAGTEDVGTVVGICVIIGVIAGTEGTGVVRAAIIFWVWVVIVVITSIGWVVGTTATPVVCGETVTFISVLLAAETIPMLRRRVNTIPSDTRSRSRASVVLLSERWKRGGKKFIIPISLAYT